MLPLAATQSHTYPNLKRTNLLWIGQLCDYDCFTLFTKKVVTIFNPDNNPVLNVKQNKSDGLWDVTITSYQYILTPTTPNKNSILRLDKEKSELESYFYAAAGWLTKSTCIQEIKIANFITWPGLITKIIYRHLSLSIPTLNGNLKQEQQNIRSTKPLPKKRNLKQNHHLTRNIRHKNIILISSKRYTPRHAMLYKIKTKICQCWPH